MWKFEEEIEQMKFVFVETGEVVCDDGTETEVEDGVQDDLKFVDCSYEFLQ